MTEGPEDFPFELDNDEENIQIGDAELSKEVFSHFKEYRAKKAQNPELLNMDLTSDIKDISYSISMRPPSDSTYFSESTIEYILDQNRVNESKNERDIEEVLSDVPLRITRLLYDLVILWKGGYLNDIDKNWRYLDDIPDGIARTLSEVYQNGDKLNNNDFDFDFGLSIGLGLSAMTGRTSEDTRSSNFLAGLMKAYSAELSRNMGGGSISEEVSEKFRQDSSDQFYLTHTSTLKRYGIEPTEKIEKYILSMMQNESVSGKKQSSSKEITQELVENVLDDTFGRCVFLREELKNEWDTIDDASIPGIDAKEVLKSLWELVYESNTVDFTSNQTSSEHIAKQANKQSRYKRQVSHVLNRLSIEGKEPSNMVETTYENNEIVYYEKGDWRLTGYGQLLLYSQFEKQGFLWIQNAGMDMCLQTDKYPDEAPEKDNEYVGFDLDILYRIDYNMVEKGVNSYFDI
jgi:hypothetical protein